MIQRSTQRLEYWQEEFIVEDEDLEYLYGLIIESGRPRTYEDLALALVERRCQKEEEAISAELAKGDLFQPKEAYEIGQKIVFPVFDYALATVVSIRPGYNPEYGEFQVIQVQFEGQEGIREFASELKGLHKLNGKDGERPPDQLEGFDPPEELYAKYGYSVQDKLLKRLRDGEEFDFVNFGAEWFLKDLMANVHMGYLNIAEAMLDVNGVPLPSQELLTELELPSEIDRSVQMFSLNYALSRDERFDNVGTDREVLWFLRRLEPPEAIYPPRRLLVSVEPYDRGFLDEELLRWEREIDDETTEAALFAPSETELASSVTFVLTYPHRRAGTIPLTARTRGFFPRSSAQRTMITLIDGRNGRHMSGWVVHQYKYVYGFDQWYEENNILVGAYITLERTEDPMAVIINYTPRRQKREWVRVAKAEGGKLTFQMQKMACGCEYDELMLFGEDNPAKVDALWIQAEETGKPIIEVIYEVFPELAKLSPQGTVHAKTLYSAVNIRKRCPPGPIFAALASRACFRPVGDGYWLYDESLKDK